VAGTHSPIDLSDPNGMPPELRSALMDIGVKLERLYRLASGTRVRCAEREDMSRMIRDIRIASNIDERTDALEAGARTRSLSIAQDGDRGSRWRSGRVVAIAAKSDFRSRGIRSA
jgi:hypothetical protein